MKRPKPIWTPSPERIAQSNLTRYEKYLKEKLGLTFENYEDLHRWSVTEIDPFWKSVWDFAGFNHSRVFDQVHTGNDIRTAQWFPEARLNFAENLLSYDGDQTAIIYQSEDGTRREISYSELRTKVAALAQLFRSIGLRPGDRVAAYISNRPEAIIGMLAATSIGAVWSSCSPDFGFEGVMERFEQIQPKVLIAIGEYQYNGKTIDCSETVRKLVESIDSIEKVMIVGDSQNEMPNSVSWSEIENKDPQELNFEQLPFDHPLYILFSSGTTGKPKCIVHGAGGTLIQHFKELSLHTDLKKGDVFTYYTTCGWMMWNWMVSSLMLGCTLYLYDGSPGYPDLGVLFQAIEKEKIKVFGTSPKFLSSCEKEGLVPKNEFDLGSLKTILSTGAPLTERNFNFVYQSIQPEVHLASISGGTDIVSCFMLGNPNAPVFPGELQCRGLGMKVETFDESGSSVTNEIGELVCSAPFPSRPIYFWNDSDGEKYQKAYFDHYERVWRHGDFVKINERGSCVVYGRSDATLNRGGVRIGTAEIYSVVESLDEVVDSLVVGLEKEEDIKVILFVVLKTGQELDKSLKAKIKSTLRTEKSPRHVPDEIHQITSVPRTISGKKVELAVKNILQGKPITNKEALVNPEVLGEFTLRF